MKEIKFKAKELEFTVRKVEWNNDNLMIDNTFRAGTTHKRTQEIYISNDLTSQMLKRVLLHEITHALILASGMGQAKWGEENVADFLESHFFEIQSIYTKTIKELLK